MFLRQNKKEKSKNRILRDFNRIQDVDKLLINTKRNNALQEVEKEMVIDTEEFQKFYLPVIHNLTTHCQLLPDSFNNYYNYLGGLLDCILQRTAISMKLFQNFVIHDHGEYSKEQKLWQYAFCTAVLLQGMGKLKIDYTVNVYNKIGQFLYIWDPLLDNMHGDYYNYTFTKEADIDFRQRLNLLIARLLMPIEGLAWISSNQPVLNMWLALLHEDYYAAGVLGALLIRANTLLLRECIQQFVDINIPPEHEGNVQRVKGFIGGQAESIDILEKRIGSEFLLWLIKQIDDKKLGINQSLLLVMPNGLLLSSEVFKLFVKSHPGFKSWVAVQSGLLSLNIPGIELDKKNIIINHTNAAIILPEQVTLHNNNTISVIEFIQQQPVKYLSAKGEWQTKAATTTNWLRNNV